MLDLLIILSLAAQPPSVPSEGCPRDKPVRFGFQAHGNAGDDRIYAGDEPARLFGDEDRDFVGGSAESDDLHGGADADTLVGGLGADHFIYDAVKDSAADSRGRWDPGKGDTIADFNTEDGDLIDFTPLLTEPLKWADEGPAPHAVWTQRGSGDTFVMVDISGDIRADIAIRLIGPQTLSVQNFCGVVE